MSVPNTEELIRKVTALPKHVFDDTTTYIHVVRNGLPGEVLKEVIQSLGQTPEFRELFVTILETTSGNLHRFYKRAALSRAESEEIMDMLQVFHVAETIFDDKAIAQEWLSTPIPALAGKKPIALSDTFKGRQLVREALQKIEYGDFS